MDAIITTDNPTFAILLNLMLSKLFLQVSEILAKDENLFFFYWEHSDRHDFT